MARRKSINKTDIKRLPGITSHEVWISFACLKCSNRSYIQIGKKFLNPMDSYLNALWKCQNCGFIHSRSSDLPDVDLVGKDLPFKAWGKKITSHLSIATQRFWKAFFTIATEYPSSYWKQCNSCGKILPAPAFSGHKGWGPLEKQLECRSCKSVINWI